METEIEAPPEEQEGQTTGQEQQGEQKPPDEMRQAMAELTKAVTTMASKKEETPREPPKLTPEQEEERWAVYNPGKTKPDFYKKFFRLAPEATEDDLRELKDLFDDMQRGFVKQSVTGAKNLFDVELQKIQTKLSELDGYVSEAQTEKIRTQFYGSYPGLDKPEFKKIVSLTAANLDPKNYKTNEEYFKALAERAAETIKGVLPTFELGAEEKGSKKPSGTPPRLPRGRAGGTGGTGAGAGAPTTTDNDVDSLEFD